MLLKHGLKCFFDKKKTPALDPKRCARAAG